MPQILLVVLLLIAFNLNSFTFAHDHVDHSDKPVKLRPISQDSKPKNKMETVENLRVKKMENVVEQRTMKEMKREEMQEKLKTFRDEKKAKVFSKVTDNINERNQKVTTQMLLHLKKIQNLLDKISDRTDQAEKNGRNVSQIRESITKTQTAIDDAKKAVETQALKDYVPSSTDESTAKKEMEALREQFRADIKVLHEQVKLARQSMVDTLKLLKTIVGSDKINTSSEPESAK